MSSELVHEYEMVYIIPATLEEEAAATLQDRFIQTIGAFDGTLDRVEPWGRRTLAYPIRKNFEGIYTLLRFTMRPDGADELDRFLRLNENILRYLIIRTDG